jgi:hypothetical protein
VPALGDKPLVRSRGDGRFDLFVRVQAYAAEHLQTDGRYAGSGPAARVSAQSRHAALVWVDLTSPVTTWPRRPRWRRIDHCC